MIYWFTGQPGHGKTLHAICKALDFKAEGRLVYCGNVRDLDYGRTGFLPITPEQFIDWPNFLPDGSVCFIDEAYEHGMLPKRPPGSKVPHHVEQLAKHRHRGIDFIFVSQSPAKQVDDFVHDLIEQQVHVRRLFGLPLVRLKIFDRFERAPNKSAPITTKRVRLPKRAFGMYKSTVMDTTQQSIPWFAYALVILFFLLMFMLWKSNSVINDNLGPEAQAVVTAEDGASAKAEDGAKATTQNKQNIEAAGQHVKTLEEYVTRFIPRIASQPWSAPAYDSLQMPKNPPRIFCMASGNPVNQCGCLTDQGTKYLIDLKTCTTIARDGQYEPYLEVATNGQKLADGHEQLKYMAENKIIDQGETNYTGPAPTSYPTQAIEQARPPAPGKNIRGWLKENN